MGDKKKVFVVVIFNRHGEDIYVHETHAGALESVDVYVNEWWEREMSEEQPDDAEEAREAYFDDARAGHGEYYEIHELELRK